MPDRFDVTRLPEHRGRRRLLARASGAVTQAFLFLAFPLFRQDRQFRDELTIEIKSHAGIWRSSAMIQTGIRRGALAEALSRTKLKKLIFASNSAA
jgi:hypothetical protein